MEFAEPREVPDPYQLVRFLVLRLLGLVYFVAFLAALRQGPGLIGSAGLLPFEDFLQRVAVRSPGTFAALLELPTLFWFDHSDGAFTWLCVLGLTLSAGVLLGATNAVVQGGLWIAYLSIAQVGQIFWAYGWEMQLLETGALSIFLCPVRSLDPFAAPPPKASIWLMRWLIARVMLGAGLIKLRGDPCWRELTCLDYHFETQPIPNPLSAWFHHAPHWIHAAGVLANHLIEVVAPLFAFGPRRARLIAGSGFVLLQAVLIASGNLSFLNWLTLVPAIACFDDRALGWMFPTRVCAWAAREVEVRSGARRAALVYAVLVGLLSIEPTLNLFSARQRMNASFDPLHLVNTYGAFGSVSRERHELILEGTRDERVSAHSRFRAYGFRCKPGDVMRSGCWISPYHLRLDWQLWFGALGSASTESWLVPLVHALLAGNPQVLDLLQDNPFDGRPPTHVRVQRYRYELLEPWDASGATWRRSFVGPVLQPVSLRDLAH